ncbi:MAG: F0F1 ATP synthase subunit B [Rhodospirillales bacterium]|jgi:F-type H+-transporting ATPase subunit b|nr:F0F1 ATP synthase subunit B [Rhodospirillaceae bacterium]MDP6428151.1 F0F1 ATP synthase subunit B [Rhodospirillales bacterium]MDP6642966.1 F0F1 ATP synthase subunit B [Rhodospirillales bacterium]MDP6840721.1 F0F1 ATP synthase subunit B [Rhodospirillales bacterium]|tara:strand:+ start:158 stop:691 length:534 start_codon:yes stop_codon:yes gene_type:complete
MISNAYAASAGAASAEPFWHSPTFWVAISFVILAALLAKPAWRIATSALDEKIAEIQNRIEEATQLREEAQNLLASYKRKLTEAEKESEDIIARARDEGQALRQRMTEELEASLKRREKQAIDRIAQAESDATNQVRAVAADLAVDATRTLLAEQAQGEKAASLIDEAIQDLPDKLN